MIAEGFDDLLVGKVEQAVALFDERDAHAQHREHAGVFDADDPAAHHDERVGQRLQAEDLVAVDNGAAIDGHLRRRGGLRTHGDDDAVGFKRHFALRALDAHVVRIDEVGKPWTTSMPLRDSCASVTSISVLITACTRKARSDMVIFSLTR